MRDYSARSEADFLEGADASALVRERAVLIDDVLRAQYRHRLGADGGGTALVAVGGYGRGRLHPGSDVDVMLLVGDTEPEAAAIEQFLQGLWDIGLEPGHSVRGLGDCERGARGDITIATALMESRLLDGDAGLFERMRARTAPPGVWPSAEFFAAKLAEQAVRHARQGDTACAVEPNVKEAVGGLRDVHTIAWVAKRHFGAESLRGLVGHGFLTEEECDALEEAEALLEAIRFNLHVRAGRREDRLLFDYQRQIAEDFGYADTQANLGVEQLMQRYYCAANDIAILNEMLLQSFEEEMVAEPVDTRTVVINARFQSVDGYLEVRDPELFARYPYGLLELFLLLQQDETLKGVRASTARLVRSNAWRIDEDFRADIRARTLFMEILRQPQGITHALRRMSRYGVLGRYLPAFGAVAGKMQYDLFHIYTVDEHTLAVLGNLRKFALHGRDSLTSEVFDRLPKPELLYLGGLFHDIAKGRGGDHSELGADDAMSFCLEHDLSAYDARMVAWLVRHHLLMSTTAQRRDISDPEVVADFAATVGDTTHLNYLYLLTVADIRGTNPKLLNDWRAMLLRDLYLATLRAMRRGLGNPIDRVELITQTEQQAREMLAQRGLLITDIERTWDALGEEYMLRYSADDVSWHTEAIIALDTEYDDVALVMVRNGRGGTEVFTYVRDRPGIFAATASTLSALGLNIVNARLHTADNAMSLNTFVVFELDGTRATSATRHEEIRARVRAALDDRAPVAGREPRRPARELRHFDTATRVRFYPDDINGRTIVELVAADRPGLLARIGAALDDCNLQVANARIGTLGERAEDTFYIERDGAPLPDAEYEAIGEALSDAAGAPA